MTGLDSLESMLVWMRERPHMYCRTVGELDSVLWYLHMTWAKFVERDNELREAVAEQLGDRGAAGLLDDCDRPILTSEGGEPLQRVIDFWSQVDARLGCRVQIDSW